MGHFTNLAVGLISALPKGLLRRLSSRYIAGEHIDDALARLAVLNAEGFTGILDILGEDTGGSAELTDAQRQERSERKASEALRQYLDAASRLHASGAQAYMSAKPTHFGLHHSEDLCHANYDALASHCKELGLFLRVEMEDHTTVTGTLNVYKRLLVDHDNVGIVLQSRLFRTLDDIQDLFAAMPANRRLHVRLVKGIYLEPARVAHTEYQPIADAFVECAAAIWRVGGWVSLATHDDIMQPRLEALRAELGIDASSFEYQVLMGVRPPLWKSWQEQGLPVRVYVPYGPDWHAYSMRRLKKNPKLLQQMALGVFSRGQ
jgi:proline dehydrogenase